MSSFGALARRITVLDHENADALELAKVDDYLAVVKKGEFVTGDLVIYIQEGSIVPDDIIEEMGLTGRLAGGTFEADGRSKKANRVKAVRLRGALSQGLVYAPNGRLGELAEGVDYAEQLGITKYQPPIPTEMAGAVEHKSGLLTYTDLENVKRFPDALIDGEEVIATEKLHGTNTVLALIGDELVVSSKGLSKQQLGLVETDANVYWRMARQYGVEAKLREIAAKLGVDSVHLYGETLGVQDLMYGLTRGQLDFRAFDLRAGREFVDYDVLVELMADADIPLVPLLYRGPYDRDTLEQVATGKEQYTGTEAHIREGVVVRPVVERYDNELGRVAVKVISPDYLLRKGDATELE